MDDALIYAIVFAAGLAFGYPIGKIITVKRLRPLVIKLSDRIAELEEQHRPTQEQREVEELERLIRQ